MYRLSAQQRQQANGMWLFNQIKEFVAQCIGVCRKTIRKFRNLRQNFGNRERQCEEEILNDNSILRKQRHDSMSPAAVSGPNFGQTR